MSEQVLGWTFDPKEFHGWLLPRVVRDRQLDLRGLSSAAAEAASARTPVAKEYLEGLRFDPADSESWDPMFAMDPDIDARDELYAIAMAGHLHAASHLSWWSHQFALVALPQLGWEGDPSFLWRGRRLDTLAEAYGDRTLAQAVEGARGSLGGWLDHREVQEQLGLLVKAGSRQLPADLSERFRGTYLETLASPDLTEHTRMALTELTTLFATAVDRGEALRLVFWS